MSSKTVLILAVIVVIAIVAIGAVAYSFLREPEAATGPIEAIPLATTGEESAVTDQPADQPTTAPQQPTPTPVRRMACGNRDPSGGRPAHCRSGDTHRAQPIQRGTGYRSTHL